MTFQFLKITTNQKFFLQNNLTSLMFDWIWAIGDFLSSGSIDSNATPTSQKKKINFSTGADEVIIQKLKNSELPFDVESPNSVKKYHDVTCIKEIFKNLISKEKQQTGNETIDWKPKLVFTQIEINSLSKWFTPNYSIPFGFIHTMVKIGPIVGSKKKLKFF